MTLQKITEEIYQAAKKNGYRIDIGQLSLSERRDLEKQVEQGTVAKCKAWWPYLTSGMKEKTCYVFLEARPETQYGFSGTDGGRAA